MRKLVAGVLELDQSGGAFHIRARVLEAHANITNRENY
jgi:hypothetical protein